MQNSNIKIKNLNNNKNSNKFWDEYVISHSEGTFFHLSNWSNVIAEAHEHDTYYIYAESEGKIVGVLPLGHIKSYFFGNSLISTPFCVYGGAIADSEEIKILLEKSAFDISDNLGVDYLEFRKQFHSGEINNVNTLYFTFRKAIDIDSQNNFQAIPRKQRAVIRKGINLGLQSKINNDVDDFYKIYSTSLRNLGTPVFKKKYFDLILKYFSDSCEILTVSFDGVNVASVLSFYFKNEILPYYGGSITQGRDLHANDFMYWELMKRSAEKGCQVFDFGRSKQGTGSYRFKVHWGFEPTPLYYEYKLIKRKDYPDINPLNPKYRYFIGLWKKLPLKISQVIGSLISSGLG